MIVSSVTQDFAPAFSRLKFLVIDDFENFRRSLKHILHGAGIRNIATAADCREAVYKCTYDRFDVVLCNSARNHNRNGSQILEELRYRKLLNKTAVFVLITAEPSRDIVMGSGEHQPDILIAKPVTRALLKARIEALVEQQQALYPINHELDVGNLPAAITLCNEFLAKLPRYRSRLAQTLADLYRRTGDYGRAHEIYAEVLRSRDTCWARLGMGKVLIAEQRWDQAIAQLQQLVADIPDCVEAYDCLARAQQENGQGRQAQTTLEAAIRISPTAILRHQQLAQVSMDNQDLEVAAEAWRQTINLSERSVHESPEHYLNLGRCLYGLCMRNSADTGKRYADEGLRVLKQMQGRFRVDAAARTSALLIAARIHASQDRQQESQQLMDSFRHTLAVGMVNATMGLDLARTLYSINEPAEAQSLLGAMLSRFGGDPGILQEIEAFLNEPADTIQKTRARAAHCQGITAFVAGRTDEAAAAFPVALELAPRPQSRSGPGSP